MKSVLVAILLSTATAVAAPAAKPVMNEERDTAVHPHLKSFTTKTVEGGKETFKEVHTFDADGRIKKLEVYKDGALLDTTEFTWDANGHLTKRSTKDDSGAVTKHEYTYTLDASGRIGTMTEGTHTDTYRWDAKGGHEVTSTRTDGGKTVFEMSEAFDATDHVIKRCTSTAMVTTAVAAKKSCEVRTYDKHGQVTQISSQPANASHPTKKLTNTYDKAGHLAKSVEAGADGAVKSFTWNDTGDLATVTEVLGGETTVTTFSYEPK